MKRPKLLDFYCCQGGASAGYVAAGFDVYGLDREPQPRYPYPFHRADAISALVHLIEGGGLRFGSEFLKLSDFAATHGSPPCQAHTSAQRIQGNDHPDLIEPTRFLFDVTGLPYVIENVVGAPLLEPVTLCGGMFGLHTYRHRLFETNWPLAQPDHPEHVARNTKMGRTPVEGEFMHVVGNFSGAARGREVMGMPWATRNGLSEAIPPAYSEHVGSDADGASLKRGGGMIVWTCCDPRGVTFCPSCGEDLKKGRTLPNRSDACYAHLVTQPCRFCETVRKADCEVMGHNWSLRP